MKVLLSGVSGAMGQNLREVIGNDSDLEIVAGFDKNPEQDASFPIYSDLSKLENIADVIIDFSHFSAFESIFDYALRTKTPIVIATTGLSDEQLATIKDGSRELPVFKTANMSLGINVLANALKSIAPILEDGFDIEIIERHHHKKADAPSGTALLWADAINGSLVEPKTYTYGRHGRDCLRKENEMGIHAIRGGTIPGDHLAVFAGNDEVLEIRHTALSKKVFAGGAVKAAKFIINQTPGLYDMNDVLNTK